MESIPENPILQYNKTAMEDIRRNIGLDKPGRMKEAVDILEKWMKEQKHFKNKDLPRRYLESTIIPCKGSLERAKRRIDKICTYRTLLPQYFGDFDLQEDFKDLRQGFTLTYMPKQTPDHYRILLANVYGDRWNSNYILQLARYVIIYSEYLKMHEYADGFLIIVDYRDLDIVEHVRHLNLIDVKHALAIVMEGIGVRVRSIHLITSSKYIELIINVAKQFLSPKLSNRIQVHMNLDSLHDLVPKDILPKEYGGKEKPLKELEEKWTDVLNSKEAREHLYMMNASSTDESLRENDVFNEEYMGMPGTFRTLSVD